MSAKVYLAVDLGAESGRVMAGVFDGARLSIDEIHRFPNNPVRVRGHLHWDILALFSEIKRGIGFAVRKHGSSVASIGVDTWGVDYGLIDRNGMLAGQPFHYRDSRTDGMMAEAFRRVPRRKIYDHTGIQFMFFNTLYQVLSEVVGASSALSVANRILFIPDLVNFWLTGVQANERTIASTSQLYDPRRRCWSEPVICGLGIPSRIFGEVVDPGTVIGPFLSEVADETGATGATVIAPGCHDTASGVAAVPAEGTRHAYLSSGTWSLMGIESDEPIISDRSYEFGFTNEIGVFDKVRVLKNISGLWLVQECRRTWAANGEQLSYDQLASLANQAPPFAAVINPDYPDFALPGDMPARIQDYCRRSGQAVPLDKGSLIRTALEGLALKYRVVLEQLEQLVSHRLELLHIVGGGTRNILLNQLTADAIGRPVITGPVEATSAGNIIMQMVGTGDLGSQPQGRELIRRSFETRIYEPRESGAWGEALSKFQGIQSMELQQAYKEAKQHG